MLNTMINQDLIDHLIDDVSYLEAESEALKYLIDTIPYDEKPPERRSIKEMLRLIDFAQHHYYRPIIERVIVEKRVINLSDFRHYSDLFSEIEEEEIEIQRVLNKIIKHRVALLTIIDKFHQIDWEKSLINDEGVEIPLFKFVENMVQNERAILKEIADLILIYQNERQHQREINKKRFLKES